MALYDAFISYSHAKDKPIAAALQSVVQTLGKPWYRRRALRIFRDDTSLAATPELWPTIVRALDDSRRFILLASPEAAVSEWVNKEVLHWLDHNSTDTLLIAVTDGALTWDQTAGDFAAGDNMPLPPVLAGRFANEPKWVDLRPYRSGADKRDAKFTELAADFAAAIHGTPKEDLLSQEVRQQRRALGLATTAAAMLLVLAILATAAGVLAYRAEQRVQKTLGAATKTADGLVFDLARRFRDTVGVPASLVKDILDRARDLQEQLVASGEITPELRRSQAEALNETARTLLVIGDTAGAFAAAARAREIARGMLTQYPDDVGWQERLGTYQKTVGNVLVAQGKLEEALLAYADSAGIAERLVQPDLTGQFDLAASYHEIGGMFEKDGKLPEALQAYRDALVIFRRMTRAWPANDEWQRNLSVAYHKVGRVLRDQGKFPEALQAFRDSFAIAERLAKSAPDNALWQFDLSTSYDDFGDAFLRERKLPEALQAYTVGVAIVEGLVKTDPGNTGWQRGLSVSYIKIGDVLKEQNKLTDALQAYRQALTIRDRLAGVDRANKDWQNDLQTVISRIGSISYKFILARNFATALEAADQAISLAPEKIWIYTNRAHALMFLNRIDEARAVYLQHRGKKNVQGEKGWETVVLEDFADLRRARLVAPLMSTIEKQFSARG